jgi:hypothetical protein
MGVSGVYLRGGFVLEGALIRKDGFGKVVGGIEDRIGGGFVVWVRA